METEKFFYNRRDKENIHMSGVDRVLKALNSKFQNYGDQLDLPQ